MTPLLEARQLRVAVPHRVLIDRFDCAIRAGEFVALLGGNGAGKSLLLRTFAGLRAPAAGSVQLDGHDIHSLARREIATRLGFLPQDPDATPQGSLAESVALGRFAHLGLLQMPDAADSRRVTQALGDVGLESLAGRELATLSGGEQRRAAIARLLVQEILRQHGAEVTIAESAAAARRSLAAQAPDVIVSDIGMPEEDGYSFIRGVRASGGRTPAIALTAYASPQDAQRAFVAGFQKHVTKPVEPARLVSVVANLGGRSL